MSSILSVDHQDFLLFRYHKQMMDYTERLPSYSSGICRIRSSSGKLICILAAKGSEQKSYQPSSAQCTNSCNVWKSLVNVSNSRHACWVWLRLNKNKLKQYYTYTSDMQGMMWGDPELMLTSVPDYELWAYRGYCQRIGLGCYVSHSPNWVWHVVYI